MLEVGQEVVTDPLQEGNRQSDGRSEHTQRLMKSVRDDVTTRLTSVKKFEKKKKKSPKVGGAAGQAGRGFPSTQKIKLDLVPADGWCS